MLQLFIPCSGGIPIAIGMGGKDANLRGAPEGCFVQVVTTVRKISLLRELVIPPCFKTFACFGDEGSIFDVHDDRK
jgi:hypothetical protein